MATVNLRIVGIYFNAPVTIDDSAIANGVTVKDVLDAYVAANPVSNPRGLAYAVKQDNSDPDGTFESVLSFTHNYDGRFDYNGDGNDKEPEDGPTLSGSSRAPGLYQLQESTVSGVANSALAWQYYVESKDASGGLIFKSKTPVSRGFTYFGTLPEDPARRIADGDKITFRLVAILLSPSVQGKAPRLIQTEPTVPSGVALRP